MGKRVYLILVIVFMILILLMLSIFGILIFQNKEQSPNLDNVPVENIEENKLKEKVIVCLDKEDNEECISLFSNSSIGEVCELIEDKNSCYYKAALVNLRSSFCDKIDNRTLNENCLKEIDKKLKKDYYLGRK